MSSQGHPVENTPGDHLGSLLNDHPGRGRNLLSGIDIRWRLDPGDQLSWGAQDQLVPLLANLPARRRMWVGSGGAFGDNHRGCIDLRRF